MTVTDLAYSTVTSLKHFDLYYPEPGTSLMSHNRQIIIQTVIHPYHGILFSNKEGLVIDPCNNLNRSQEHYVKWKNIQS